MTQPNSTPTKTCTKCGAEKTFDLFGKKRVCKACLAAAQNEWRNRKPRIDPLVERLPVTRKELTAIFSRVEIDLDISYNGSHCWLWTGQLNEGGYARAYYRGYSHNAHRLMFQIFVGRIEGKNQGDHLCRVRRCINPVHVEDVSGRINTLRGENQAAQNARKTRCKRGHEFTPENTFIKNHYGNPTRVCLICRRRDGVLRYHRIHPESQFRERSLGHRD